MKLKYDGVAKALYIEVGKDGIVKRTVEISQDAFLDYGEDSKLIGIELLNVEKKNIDELQR